MVSKAEDDPGIINLPVQHNKLEVRRYFNKRFPALEVDPVEILESTAEGTFTSLLETLSGAEMHEHSLSRLRERNLREFRSFLTMSDHYTGPKLVIERGTGYKMTVVPAGYLGNVVDQFFDVAKADMSLETAFYYGAHMCLMYNYGLLVFDEIDPWKTIDDENADTVSKGIAASLLCTGTDVKDGSIDVPASLIPNYMKNILPNKFASTLTYTGLQKRLLASGSCTAEIATWIVDKFIEQRIEMILAAEAESAKKKRPVAISDVDYALAHPLTSDELHSFIKYASMLDVSLRTPYVVRDILPGSDTI